MDGPAHLVFISGNEPGYSRKQRGRGFEYFDEKNKKITQPETLQRVKNLVIPPMWNNVWICPDENGHLQATGMDSKQRKQYLYHPDWIKYRKDEKFARMFSFGNCLPEISRKYTKDLRKHGWPKEKVVALIIYLLDNHYFRVGNPQYTRENQSYGITTLRRKHLENGSGGLIIRYVAKSGKLRKVKIDNRTIIKKIRQISELPGYEVFRYLDDEGNTKRIDSRDINEYLFNITGDDFTAKDFRTWGASKLAIEFYDKANLAIEENPHRKFETTLLKQVAEAIGNTVSTCRKYYIHPGVLSFLSTHAPKPLKKVISLRRKKSDMLDEYEHYLLYLLKRTNE